VERRDDVARVDCAAGSLTPRQIIRLAEAIAVLQAQRAALLSGVVSADDLDLYTWTVDVDAVYTQTPHGRGLGLRWKQRVA
jgi:hypothetical protein